MAWWTSGLPTGACVGGSAVVRESSSAARLRGAGLPRQVLVFLHPTLPPQQVFLCEAWRSHGTGRQVGLQDGMIGAEHKLGCMLWTGAMVLSPHVSGWRRLALPWSSVLGYRSLEAFLFSSLFFFSFHSCIRISFSYSFSDENKLENSHMLNTLSATSGLSKEACAWAKFCRGKQLLCFMKSAFKEYTCHLVTSWLSSKTKGPLWLHKLSTHVWHLQRLT